MTFLASAWKLLDLPKNLQLRIMRLFQDQFLIGVTGIIFNTKDEILLFRHTYSHSAWGLPGGYIKSKEHPKEGLEREIEEESNLTVSVDARYKIRTDRDTARLDIVYTGSFIGGTFKPSKEVVEAQFFSFKNLPNIRKNDLIMINRILEKRKQLHTSIL